MSAPAAPSQEPPSPTSPPSAPPTQLSPGPRAAALQRIYDDAIDRVVGACSYENFASCFPTPAEHAGDALNALHRKFASKLGDVCRSEFQALLEHRSVVQSLNELDDLVKDAKGRKAAAESTAQQNGAEVPAPQPPHLLPANALLAAHLEPVLAAQTQALEKELDDTNKENAALTDTLIKQRAEIEALVTGLERTVADVEQAAVLLRESEEMEIAREELEQIATGPSGTGTG